MQKLPHKIETVRELPPALLKPNPEILNQVMAKYGLRKEQVLVIGDSVPNDLGVANNGGVKAILVTAGIPARDFQATFLRLKPLPLNPEIHNIYGIRSSDTPLPRIATSRYFSELLNHLNPKTNYKQVSSEIGNGLKILPPWQSICGYSLDQSIIPDKLQ